MEKEAILKNRHIFNVWLNGAKIQYYDKDTDKWIDIEDPTWDLETQYRMKSPQIEFEDCHFNETEYYVNEGADVTSCFALDYDIYDRMLFFKDKEIAEAYATLPQLIRLMDEYNEGWKPNYKDKEDKHCIGYYEGELDLFSNQYTQRILVFKTEEIRDKFLEDHRDLIEIAKPLL